MSEISQKLREAYHNDLTDVPLLIDAAEEIDRLRSKLAKDAEASALIREAAELIKGKGSIADIIARAERAEEARDILLKAIEAWLTEDRDDCDYWEDDVQYFRAVLAKVTQ